MAQALQRHLELGVAGAAQHLHELIARQHQLADQVHQVFQQLDVDPNGLVGDRGLAPDFVRRGHARSVISRLVRLLPGRCDGLDRGLVGDVSPAEHGVASAGDELHNLVPNVGVDPELIEGGAEMSGDGVEMGILEPSLHQGRVHRGQVVAVIVGGPVEGQGQERPHLGPQGLDVDAVEELVDGVVGKHLAVEQVDSRLDGRLASDALEQALGGLGSGGVESGGVVGARGGRERGFELVERGRARGRLRRGRGGALARPRLLVGKIVEAADEIGIIALGFAFRGLERGHDVLDAIK